jgi:mannose-6-phosphate isomerase-like protein (cupin superfamily)
MDCQNHPLTPSDTQLFETLVDHGEVMINHVVVPALGGFEAHPTDSNVYIQVLRGQISLTFADGSLQKLGGGQIIEIPYRTMLKIDNQESLPLELIVIKAPNPKRLT